MPPKERKEIERKETETEYLEKPVFEEVKEQSPLKEAVRSSSQRCNLEKGGEIFKEEEMATWVGDIECQGICRHLHERMDIHELQPQQRGQ